MFILFTIKTSLIVAGLMHFGISIFIITLTTFDIYKTGTLLHQELHARTITDITLLLYNKGVITVLMLTYVDGAGLYL